MTLLSFVRCRHCGLPHEASRKRCPFTNEPIKKIDVLPDQPIEEVVGPSLVGEIIGGRYEIDALIGEGAMGSVFAARDVGNGREVALKILHASLQHVEKVRRRFIREARATSAIQHQNVIRVIDAGTSDLGLPFLVMELVDGEPLDRVLDAEGVLPLGAAIEIAIQILDGLRAAHQAGVVHRDIKPENIFICAGTRQRAKILDFSVARLLGDVSRFTATGEVIGTPAFLAPEQAMGLKVGPRADAWAATVVFYEMLTGELPFEGEHIGHIVQNIVHGEHVPPSHRRPGLPAPVDDIVAMGLEKNPAARADAEHLRDQLLALADMLGLEEMRDTVVDG